GDSITLQGGSICSLALTKDGATLAVPSCNDSVVGFFGLDGHSTIARIASTQETPLAYSSDGAWFVTGGGPNGFTIREARSLKSRFHVPFPASLGFTPDSKYLFVIGADGRGGRYDFRARKLVSPPATIKDHDQISAWGFDRASGRVAIGYHDGTVVLL